MVKIILWWADETVDKWTLMKQGEPDTPKIYESLISQLKSEDIVGIDPSLISSVWLALFLTVILERIWGYQY